MGVGMNERIEQCLYLSGLTAQGCWDELDDYAKQGIYKFGELIVQECLDIVNRKEYSYHEADPLWETSQLIKQHFGVK
jgi:hypothetical protein